MLFLIVKSSDVFISYSCADPESKLSFEMNLKLLCESSWVYIPEHLNMSYSSRTFSVRIDPCGLPVGEHFTWVSK